MSFTQALRETFQREYKGAKDANYDYRAIYRQRLIEFRKPDEAVVRLEKPTNLARARSLGYKAKQGIIVVRSRVRRGSGLHRRPKRMGVNKLTRRIPIQTIAEQRAASKYPNCEVLNSYWVGEDGKNKYYEVILVDVAHPGIKSDRDLGWLCEPHHANRVDRGLTGSGKKARGMRKKGKGTEKNRPSLRAHDRMAK